MTTQTMNIQCPPGCKVDAHGAFVPEHMIKPRDLLCDQLVNGIVAKARTESARLGDFKAETFADISAFVEASAEQYGVKLGGEKGNVTLVSYDGRFKVIRAHQETFALDERVQAAKALIDECMTDWMDGAMQEAKTLITRAFRVDEDGQLSVARVLELRQFNFNDSRWTRAMDAINDALRVVGSKSYIRVYERVDSTSKWKQIPLDVAGV